MRNKKYFYIRTGTVESVYIDGKKALVCDSNKVCAAEYWDGRTSKILDDFLRINSNYKDAAELERNIVNFCKQYGLPVYDQIKMSTAELGMEGDIEEFSDKPYFFYNKISYRLFLEFHALISSLATLSVGHSTVNNWKDYKNRSEYSSLMFRTIFFLFENPVIMFFGDDAESKEAWWNSIRWSNLYVEARKEEFILGAICSSMYKYGEELKRHQKEIDEVKKKLGDQESLKSRLGELMMGTSYEYKEKQIRIIQQFMELIEQKILILFSQDEEIYFYDEMNIQMEWTEEEINVLNRMVAKINCDYINWLLKWLDVGVSYTMEYALTSSTTDTGCFAAIVLGLVSVIESKANLRVCPICNRPFLPSTTHPNQITCGGVCSRMRNEMKRKGNRKR